MSRHPIHRWTGLALRAGAAIAGLMILPATSHAQVSADSLQALTRRVARLEQELEQLRTAPSPPPLVTPPVIRPNGRESSLTVGGVVQVQGEFRDRGDARFTSGNDRLYLRRARLNAAGVFLEDYEFRLEMELAGSLAEAAGLRAQLTDGSISWNRFPAAVVRAGQFKTPYGFEQLYLDPRTLTIERSLPNDRLTLGRQLGLQIGGDLLAKRAGYAIGLFNGTGVNNDLNDSDNFLYVARVTATPWQRTTRDRRWTVGGGGFDAHDVALSGQPGEWAFDSTPGDGKPDNLFNGRRRGFGVDTQLRVGRAELWLEYLHEHFQPTNRLPLARFDSRGGYAQFSVFLVPARYQALVKFETYDPNRSKSHDRTNNLVVGLTDFVKGDDIRLQVNYLRTTPEKNAAGGSRGQDKLLVKLQTIF